MGNISNMYWSTTLAAKESRSQPYIQHMWNRLDKKNSNRTMENSTLKQALVNEWEQIPQTNVYTVGLLLLLVIKYSLIFLSFFSNTIFSLRMKLWIKKRNVNKYKVLKISHKKTFCWPCYFTASVYFGIFVRLSMIRILTP